MSNDLIRLMRDALRKVYALNFPETGRFWEDGQPMSYGAAYGSSGQRDYMIEVARQALAAAEAYLDGAVEPMGAERGANLTGHQAQALSLLHEDARRDLYVGHGGTEFWCTYLAGRQITPWQRSEIEPMVAAGLLVMRYEDCYTTPCNLAQFPNRASKASSAWKPEPKKEA